MALPGGKLLEWLQHLHHGGRGAPPPAHREERPVGVHSSLLSLEQVRLARGQVIHD